jgi:methylenetetrahydrofolate reductase (NADPH)
LSPCAAICRPVRVRPAISGSRASSSPSSGEETGDWFHIDVAAYPECHPQARSPQEDLVAFKKKIDAGANSAMTQYFYNPDAYWHFVDACSAAGITVPIVPGIMPIGSYSKLARFSDACGAEIPRWIRMKLQGYG